MRLSTLYFTLLLFCSSCTNSVGQPPELHLGQDECYECHMQISEERFAAARTIASEVQLFDDLAELFIYRRKNPNEQESLWVHDFNSHNWIKASQATYLHSASLKTPMGFGLVAFQTREQALEANRSYPGKILTFEEACQTDFLKAKTNTTKMELHQ